MHELLNYVIRFFSDRMTEKEKLAYKHLLAISPLKETEQRLLNGLAWEESQGNILPAWAKSVQLRHQSCLSHDPEVLQLTSDGLEAFLKRAALRILTEDWGQIYINKCSSCGALARTPKARQCRHCGFDWHDKPPIVPVPPTKVEIL